MPSFPGPHQILCCEGRPAAAPSHILRWSAVVRERVLAAPPEAGRVHSIFERAVNILWHDGGLITLHGPAPLAAPFAAALTRLYGSVDADSARGLQLRMDNGTQYLADHFLNQIRYWGMQASFAFIEQPQTNGVAERFNRTLKEQVVHGRIFRNVEELRTAVAAFVELYNDNWRIEKLGFLTPTEARLHYTRGVAA